jgi:hypothetical protein
MRRHAFSVLEVLIAALILGVTSMTIYPMFVSSQQMQTQGRYRLLAASFARETMETLRARPLHELTEGSGVDPIQPADHPFNAALKGLRRWEIRDVYGTGFAGAAEVGRDFGPKIAREVGEGFRKRGKLLVVTVSWDARELGEGVRSEERLVLYRSGALPAVLFP